MILVKIASIPNRIRQLESTICKLLDDVDQVDVYLNNYLTVPQFLNQPKIQVFTSQEYGDKGDIGKFFQIEHASGYVLTLDDDLFYPDNYVQTMINKIDFYNRRAFVCVHANQLPKHKLSSYYQNKLGIHFEGALEEDTRVDIPGTGTLGFHTEKVKLTSDIFIRPNMTDIWLAIHAKDNGIPIICVRRKSLWLTQARGEEFNRSIYKSSLNNDSYQTHVINTSLLVVE
jgi:hypothetical protein